MEETAEQWVARKRMEFMQERAEEDRLLLEIKDFSVEALMEYYDRRLPCPKAPK